MTGGRVLEYEGKRIFNEGAVYQKEKSQLNSLYVEIL